jgi:antitoxin component HigA of HigAB toxin-antitoxin module
MAGEVKPIRTKRDYEAALKEVERLWGAKTGTRDGDRLDVLATLIDAYETEHYPMDPPRRSNSAWSSKGSPGGIWKRSLARALALPRY